MKTTLLATIAAAAISLGGCGGLEIEKTADMTGDERQDILVKNGALKYLFIGQEDGTYERAQRHRTEGAEFYKTDDGKVYFFDGEIYKESTDEPVKKAEKTAEKK